MDNLDDLPLQQLIDNGKTLLDNARQKKLRAEQDRKDNFVDKVRLTMPLALRQYVSFGDWMPETGDYSKNVYTYLKVPDCAEITLYYFYDPNKILRSETLSFDHAVVAVACSPQYSFAVMPDEFTPEDLELNGDEPNHIYFAMLVAAAREQEEKNKKAREETEEFRKELFDWNNSSVDHKKGLWQRIKDRINDYF